MNTDSSALLIDIFKADKTSETRKLAVEKYFSSVKLPLKITIRQLLTTNNVYEPPSGVMNVTQYFLEAYVKKIQSLYTKEIVKAHSIEQLQEISNNLHKAQVELKIYLILQKQKNNPNEAAQLTEKLLSKSDDDRQTLCKNPELLSWLVVNSKPELSKVIANSNITQSNHWGKNINSRDEIEIKIKLKNGINEFDIFKELENRWLAISQKAEKANVSLRVNTEMRDILNKLKALNEVNERKRTNLPIHTLIEKIDRAKQLHDKAEKYQTKSQKVTHSITHLRDTAKKLLQHSKAQKIEKQTKEHIEESHKRRSTISKPW